MFHVEHPLQGGIGVIAQALSVGDGDQHQVKGQCSVIAVLEVTVTDQPLVDPTELTRNAAEPLRTEDSFFDLHNLRWFSPRTSGPEWFAPWLADAGWFAPRDLVTVSRSNER